MSLERGKWKNIRKFSDECTLLAHSLDSVREDELDVRLRRNDIDVALKNYDSNYGTSLPRK